MNVDISTGSVFQFDSYGGQLTAICIERQGNKLQCFRVVTERDSKNTIEMHMQDGRSLGPNFRIAYKSKFTIRMPQVRKYFFTCVAADLAWAKKIHDCLVPLPVQKRKLEELKRTINYLSDDEREQALKKIDALSDEVYERECVFLREYSGAKEQSFYDTFRVTPNQKGISQIYGLYQEQRARKIYR